MRIKNNPLLPYFALFFGLVVIGSSGIWVRLAEAPGPVTAFYRMAIGSLILAVPFIMNLRKRGKLDRFGVQMAVWAGLFFGLDIVLWATGVMLSGAILILGLDLQQSTSIGRGSFYGLLAAAFYGGFFLFVQRGRETLDALSFFWISSATSALTALGFVLLLDQPLVGYPPKTYWVFIVIGVIIQAIGWLAINYVQGHLPASIVSPTLLGQPVVTALIAVPVLEESMSVLQILGGAAVLAGVYIVHRSRQKDKQI